MKISVTSIGYLDVFKIVLCLAGMLVLSSCYTPTTSEFGSRSYNAEVLAQRWRDYQPQDNDNDYTFPSYGNIAVQPVAPVAPIPVAPVPAPAYGVVPQPYGYVPYAQPQFGVQPYTYRLPSDNESESYGNDNYPSYDPEADNASGGAFEFLFNQ